MSRDRSHAYFEELPSFELASVPKHAREPSVLWSAQHVWPATPLRAGAILDIAKVCNDFVLLEYRCGDDAISEQVRLTFKAQNFGGVRTFMLCPGCGQRCTTLCIAGTAMRCRWCLQACGVVHASQGKNGTGRALRKYLKLRAQVEPGSGTERANLMYFPDRPKRMRQATYARIKADALDARDRYWGGLNARFGPRLTRMLDRTSTWSDCDRTHRGNNER